MERAEVAVVVIDAERAADRAGPADHRDGRGVRPRGGDRLQQVGPVDDERRYYLDREIERELVRVQWAPRVNVSALTGWHVDRLVPALDRALEGWETRVPTGRAERVPRPAGRRAPAPGARRQAAADPVRHPGRHRARRRFVLFTTGPLEAAYMRFIERRLREEFGFVGTPIHLTVKPREKRSAAEWRRDRQRRWLAFGQLAGRPRSAPGPRPCSPGRHAAGRSCQGQGRRRWSLGRLTPLRWDRGRRQFRAVAQLGSALDWGSRGRRFKSCQPDRGIRRSEAVFG